MNMFNLQIAQTVGTVAFDDNQIPEINFRPYNLLGDLTKPVHRTSARVLPGKKRKREARILKAASLLFARQGYSETSIEAIALRADVAVGTVYNYFQSKPALLKHVLASGRSESLRVSSALAKDPPGDPVEAISQLLIAQMRGANRHDKELWRVIHATAAIEPEEFGLDYFLVKEQFKDHITLLLNTLRDRGQLQHDINIEIAAKTIKYIASEVFRRYVIDDHRNLESAISELKLMMNFIVGLAIVD
ncbi:TetR/AcrR family transcriptional regulator [Alphaproteobacteria bacterium]|nr:TetR/AcrR family transcriptional regulator [Alphaproteobacteria bacterium]